MSEVWKVIDFENGKYSVSNLGRVRNNIKGNIKTPLIRDYETAKGKKKHPQQKKFNYNYIHLYTDTKSRRNFINRLVANAFVSNPDPIDYKYVKHTDGNKLNNHCDNLRWSRFVD